MRPLLTLSVLLLALTFASCGGDDETGSTTTGASGASGAQGPAVDTDLTANEFIDESIPDQLAAVVEAVDANPDCEDVDTSPGGDFQVSVAIDAASAPTDTPLSEIVAENC